MTLLEGRGLTKKFGGVVAIEDVSFTVERGEAVGLIGPNGAGKSTLFRTITGVHPPTEGEVYFDGDEITGKSQHEICHRGLAKTHQIVRPFESLSLLENVVVGAEYGGREFDDTRARAREMLEFVDLGDQMHADPGELSVGGLKRLEIARVLATDPEMVLFDEVAGGLDPEETEGIIDLVGDIVDEGKTVFLIDHVMRALMSVSERVMVLDNGKLIAEGTPDEIQNDDEVIEAYLGEHAGKDLSDAVADDEAIAGD
ncbi:ABC transporter ATP-binding protein [Halobellus clavatus]|jgi:branched-chain amino acid transport system ATP-binding protein|uniref:Branched-chain amino acid transport system ATP-binding protein n=1 Tax=Halobellus clavatus TaxID=660517 RepID=A0A1H3GZE0_9EURY|nr:ABC transporter ATP-binding protein [Halobellus clavatus]SDY08676.1 branched-chain amino acid transport system ATP-binding protein [Halobellus clavatus]